MKKAIYIALTSALITTAAIKAAPAIAQAPGHQPHKVPTVEVAASPGASASR